MPKQFTLNVPSSDGTAGTTLDLQSLGGYGTEFQFRFAGSWQGRGYVVQTSDNNSVWSNLPLNFPSNPESVVTLSGICRYLRLYRISVETGSASACTGSVSDAAASSSLTGITQYQGEAQTADATLTTVITIDTSGFDDGAYGLWLDGLASSETTPGQVLYLTKQVLFSVAAGAPTEVDEDNVAAQSNITGVATGYATSTSALAILVRVTGAAATNINWKATATLYALTD